MELLYYLAEIMVYLIITAAFLQLGLYLRLSGEIQARTTIMADSLRNTLKGVSGTPDYDSGRSIHDEIGAILYFIGQLKSENQFEYEKVVANARMQDERKLGFGTFRVETMANIGGAMVQIFPLLGILGTILAIAKSAAESPASTGGLDPAAVTSSFAIAMDTTILGIFFGIVYMLVDSTFQARVSELLSSSEKYGSFIDNLQFKNRTK